MLFILEAIAYRRYHYDQTSLGGRGGISAVCSHGKNISLFSLWHGVQGWIRQAMSFCLRNSMCACVGGGAQDWGWLYVLCVTHLLKDKAAGRGGTSLQSQRICRLRQDDRQLKASLSNLERPCPKTKNKKAWDVSQWLPRQTRKPNPQTMQENNQNYGTGKVPNSGSQQKFDA